MGWADLQTSATDIGAAGGLQGSRWAGDPVVKWCHGAGCSPPATTHTYQIVVW